MAYWVNKNGKKWLYHKNRDGKYITPVDLGFVTDAEADLKIAQYNVDHSKRSQHQPRRSMMSIYAEFMKWLVDNNYEESTVGMMPTSLLSFVQHVPTVADLNEQAVRQHEQRLIDYRGNPKSPDGRYSLDTRMIRMRNVKWFINWMVDQKIISVKPCRIEIKQGRRDAKRDIGSDLAKQFVATLAPRSRGVGAVIMFGGLRLSPALAIQGEWINHPDCSITLPANVMKNDDPLTVFFKKTQMEFFPKDKKGPAWDGLTPYNLAWDWKQAKKKIGIVGRFRIHDGRVSSASEVWRKTKDLALLKARHGWRDTATAISYVKVTEDQHREAAEKLF